MVCKVFGSEYALYELYDMNIGMLESIYDVL